MINKFIYEPDDLVVDYLKYKGKKISFYLRDMRRLNHQNTLSYMVIVDFVMKDIGGLKSTYIIDMNDYFLWKRILKLKKLKTQMI